MATMPIALAMMAGPREVADLVLAHGRPLAVAFDGIPRHADERPMVICDVRSGVVSVSPMVWN